eukprot:gene20370-14912_t
MDPDVSDTLDTPDLSLLSSDILDDLLMDPDVSDTLDTPDLSPLPTDLEDKCGSFSNEAIVSSLLDELIVFNQSVVNRCERNRSLVPLSPAFLESINIGNHATTSDRKAFGLLMDF